MSLPISPGCHCNYCTHASTGVCDRCHSSFCARARWHGFMCNREAEDRHRTTQGYQTQDNPIDYKAFRGGNK